jgi:8-oxo-dGTP pyrophosphatase MutT (NUDIX family)
LEWNTISPQHIEIALQIDDFDAFAAHRHMAPMPRPIRRPDNLNGSAKLAAVLLLLFPKDDHLSTVMIKRNEYPGVHSGQIGLPGGRQEDGETFDMTALRETYEELGIQPSHITLIGQLTPIYIPPSDFEVHPFVGYTPQHPTWQPDPNEVADIVETPIAAFFDDTLKKNQEIHVDTFTITAPYYDINGHQVWGATAIILSEFEHRLRAVFNGKNPASQ